MSAEANDKLGEIREQQDLMRRAMKRPRKEPSYQKVEISGAQIEKFKQSLASIQRKVDTVNEAIKRVQAIQREVEYKGKQ